MDTTAGEKRVPSLGFRWLILITSVTTYALVVLGGVVRATESGDACPDWPRCRGELIPPLESAVLIEFSHRLLASVVGLLVVATAVVAWRERHRAPVIFWGAAAAVALVGGQIVLGGLTVLNDLPSSLVMAHLALAAILLATLLVLTLVSFASEPAERPPAAEGTNAASFRNLAVVAAVATFALMLTGSYVSGSGAGLAFRDWPLFNGQLLPEGGRLAMIHATHRLAALLVGLLLAYVAARAWRSRQGTPIVLGAAFALALYVAQALVGAANIWTLLQPAAMVAHLALAVALWATLVAVAVLAYGPALERTLASAGEAAPWPADGGAVAAARGQS